MTQPLHRAVDWMRVPPSSAFLAVRLLGAWRPASSGARQEVPGPRGAHTHSPLPAINSERPVTCPVSWHRSRGYRELVGTSGTSAWGHGTWGPTAGEGPRASVQHVSTDRGEGRAGLPPGTACSSRGTPPRRASAPCAFECLRKETSGWGPRPQAGNGRAQCRLTF